MEVVLGQVVARCVDSMAAAGWRREAAAEGAFRLHEATVSFNSLARILDGVRNDPSVLESGKSSAMRA